MKEKTKRARFELWKLYQDLQKVIENFDVSSGSYTVSAYEQFKERLESKCPNLNEVLNRDNIEHGYGNKNGEYKEF